MGLPKSYENLPFIKLQTTKTIMYLLSTKYRRSGDSLEVYKSVEPNTIYMNTSYFNEFTSYAFSSTFPWSFQALFIFLG